MSPADSPGMTGGEEKVFAGRALTGKDETEAKDVFPGLEGSRADGLIERIYVPNNTGVGVRGSPQSTGRG